MLVEGTASEFSTWVPDLKTARFGRLLFPGHASRIQEADGILQEAAAASGGETISLLLHEWRCLFQMDFHSNVKASRPG